MLQVLLVEHFDGRERLAEYIFGLGRAEPHLLLDEAEQVVFEVLVEQHALDRARRKVLRGRRVFGEVQARPVFSQKDDFAQRGELLLVTLQQRSPDRQLPEHQLVQEPVTA